MNAYNPEVAMMAQEIKGPTVEMTPDEHAGCDTQMAPGLIRLFPWSDTVAPEIIAVSRKLTIGREEAHGCDIVINEESVSRKHATIQPVESGFSVFDLGSYNGTFVSEKRIENSQTVYFGEVVRFGRCIFLVVKSSVLYRNWWKTGGKGPIVGGPKMAEIRQLIRRFGPMKNTVLILGESGTGKELVASELHRFSQRSEVWVDVNCAAIPDTLFEALFFGYEKNIHSAATKSEVGFFVAADTGTIFLDEVGDLSPSAQAKILRVIQEKTVRPLGSKKSLPVDVRIVAATNQNLPELVEKRGVRRDLYERLYELPIRIPPLRERLEDIVLLSSHFLKEYDDLEIKQSAIMALLQYPWPGNVRELKNVLTLAAAEVRAENDIAISRKHLRPEIANLPDKTQKISAVERRSDAVIKAMRKHKGNVKAAAEELDLARQQIYRVLQHFGRTADEFRKG